MSTTTTARSATVNAPNNGTASRAGKRRNCVTAKDVAPNHNKKPSWFTSFAQKAAQLAGRPATFMLATLVIVVWGITGPLFGYSDTWQLVINTGTTVITFLMVFLIQHTQNRDSL